MTRPLGLKSVSNPVAAQGGTDPEPADQARRTMPLGTRTLGRAVSLLDYEDFAIAFTGIAKAQAQVLQLPGGPTIAITVAGQDGAALSSADPVWNNLLLALKASGDPHVNVVLLSYQASTLPPRTEGQARSRLRIEAAARGGRGGVARALLVRLAVARATGAAVRRDRRGAFGAGRGGGRPRLPVRRHRTRGADRPLAPDAAARLAHARAAAASRCRPSC